jgi:hypothetical protein
MQLAEKLDWKGLTFQLFVETKFAVSPMTMRTLKIALFFLHVMHCFSVVMKSGCSTLKRVVSGFSPERPGFDLRAVCVEHSTATSNLLPTEVTTQTFLRKFHFKLV